MSLSRVKRSEAELLLPTYDRQPVLFTRGRGVHLYDDRGKGYLDFLSGIGVNALGYSHKAVQRVVARQSRRLIHVSNLFFHEYQAKLAARLVEISGLDRAFFCNSGTEAFEAGLKLARLYARRDGAQDPKWRILALEDSFHGRTFGSLSTTGQAKYRDPFAPLVPGVSFVRFDDPADLQAQFDDTVCAVCIETIQGEGGIRPLGQTFVDLARRLTKEKGALLIADEIQCGLGRTGSHFAYQGYSVVPDIVTVAKPLAAGLPLAAVLTTNEVSLAMRPGLHGSTFGGGPLSCAVALAFLDALEGLLPHVRKVGRYFKEGLSELGSRHPEVVSVRGEGLMLGMELSSPDLAKSVVAKLLQQGILINRTHETVLRFLPPYIVKKKHVDRVLQALDAALASPTVPRPNEAGNAGSTRTGRRLRSA